MARKKVARIVFEVDDDTDTKFTKMAAVLNYTKKHILNSLVKQFLIDAEGYPTGALFGRGTDVKKTTRTIRRDRKTEPAIGIRF